MPPFARCATCLGLLTDDVALVDQLREPPFAVEPSLARASLSATSPHAPSMAQPPNPTSETRQPVLPQRPCAHLLLLQQRPITRPVPGTSRSVADLERLDPLADECDALG